MTAPETPRSSRIGFVLPSLHFGGAERATLTLARALQARGVDVDILLMQKAGQFLDEVGDLNVVDLRCRRTFQLPFALARYLWRESPDILICNFWKLSLCACVARLVRPACKLLIWEHAKPSDSPIHTPLMYGVTSSLFYRMGTVVAVSHAVAHDLLSITRGLKDRTVVINNPIPEPIGTMRNDSADFIFVGRLETQKNPILALEAFAIAGRNNDTRMAFAGDGSLRAALEQRAIELGIAGRVTFLGFVTDPNTYMRSARVLVLSSDSEGLGNVLVEALYSGLGIASTDCGGPRDILGDQQYGRLVPIGNATALATAMVMEWHTPRDPLVQKKAAQRFSPHCIANQFMAIGKIVL